MPVPSKKQGENEEEFISRCMGDEVMKDEYGDIAQRYAVCIGSFEGKEDMTLFKYQYQKKNDINKLRNIGREIAIKSNMFQFKSYSDYGDEIKNNAKRGIELNEKNGNKCATQTGKVRAQQLAQGEPISEETIKRMYSYLSRAETYYDSADSNSDCGYISFLLWGGKSALSWSENKLKQIERQKFNDVNMDVYGYKTKYFYICPGAIATFEHLVLMDNDDDTKGMIRSAAVVADSIFKIEDDVLKSKVATTEQLNEAIILVDDFKDIINEVDKISGMKHDVSYMDNHIDVIKSYVKESMAEIGPRGGIKPSDKAPKSDK